MSATLEMVREAAVCLGGEVVTGPTHADALTDYAIRIGLADSEWEYCAAFEVALDTFGDVAENGFVTSVGRFVDRDEALLIARAARQPLAEGAGNHSGGGLFAEDCLPEMAGV